MPTGDFPQMAAAAYQNSSYGTQELMGGAGAAFISNARRAQQLPSGPSQLAALDQLAVEHNLAERLERRVYFANAINHEEEAVMPTRRIVQVYIADPCDDVPLADAILYSGEQKMTDLTDQELFFEIDIKGVLAAHNAKRTKVVNKKVKDRTEYLEPAKVRDLKMVVVTVAGF